jgi:hypothetical protein
MESLGFVLMYFLRGSLPWQGLKANTKKQKYQRILERKQATHPEQLCRGYPTEFRDFFAHCSSLGFEDRPDYRYLKRIFKDLFERQAFEDDGVYDWDVIKKQQEKGAAPYIMPGANAEGAGEEGDNDDDQKKPGENGPDQEGDGGVGATGLSGVGGAAGNGGGAAGGVGGLVGDAANSRQDEGAENREPGQRRSIISSIR